MQEKIDGVDYSGCPTQEGRTSLSRRCSRKEEYPRDNRFLGRNGLENNRIILCEEMLERDARMDFIVGAFGRF